MAGNEGSSLRELLGATKDPEFELKLLPGWERHTPGNTDRERMEAALKKRLTEVKRPDLHGFFRAQVDQAHDLMKQQGVVAYFAATGETDSKAIVPASILATVRRSPDGGTLDALVTDAVREYGAEPLFGDRRFMRFERETTKTVEGGQIVMTTIVYLTPIPGSNRRRALQLTASLARPPEMAADDEKMQAWKATLDLCVSTLRWKPPATPVSR